MNSFSSNLFTPEPIDTLEHQDGLSNNSWQEQLKNTVNTVSELCKELNLNSEKLPLSINPKFPIRVPKYYLNKISKNNFYDPLLLQVLPLDKELNISPQYCQDPLEEHKFLKAPGLIHKYKSRALLTLTSACGIHCRYCFRQNFPYSENIVSTKQRHLQLDYIKNNRNINEIILSGGDPLCVSNKYLDSLFASLSKIAHVKTIRFHTRMPIVIPDRIDIEFINILNKYNHFKFVLVTHCNHPNELDNYIKNKLLLLKNNNVLLLNQAVLLNNINNNSETLIKLSYKLFNCHILPYYLHLLDPVQGASHFDIDELTAKNLMKEVRAELPGYLVPKLVREIPGESSKTIMF